MTGTVHRLVIPSFHPPRLNQWKGRHWAVEHRLKMKDRPLIGWCARVCGVPEATGKRQVSLVLTFPPRQRFPDEDAYWKWTLDALKANGLLVNDSPRWCHLGSVTYVRGPERSTEIVLEEME